MLVLSRKEDESVILGENIKVKVISIERGYVKLGFEAPSDCLILRDELKVAVESENRKAQSDISSSELLEFESRFNFKGGN